MEEKKERLNKYLAACGICSRREADRIIEMGKVTVDGEIASMGMQVTGQEEIAVHGKKVFGKNDKVVLAYYKPAGVTCTEKDRHAERKISDELKYPVRLTYAGLSAPRSAGSETASSAIWIIRCGSRISDGWIRIRKAC